MATKRATTIAAGKVVVKNDAAKVADDIVDISRKEKFTRPSADIDSLTRHLPGVHADDFVKIADNSQLNAKRELRRAQPLYTRMESQYRKDVQNKN